MNPINETDSYFLEGTGTSFIENEKGVSSLIHLQSMTLDLSASMQKVYGGESNAPVYTYQDERGATLTMKNASMSMALMAATQGVEAKKEVAVFMDEDVEVAEDGTITTKHEPIAGTLRAYNIEDGSEIALTDGKATSMAGKTVKVIYDYLDKDNTVGVEIMSTSIAGYVHIRYRSKVLPQKDGRKLRLIVDIPKARSDGSFKIDAQHKNAFAPEVKFEVVDPENGKPMVTVAYQNVA